LSFQLSTCFLLIDAAPLFEEKRYFEFFALLTNFYNPFLFRVYNMAAFYILNPDMKSYQFALQKKREQSEQKNNPPIVPRKNKTDEQDKVERKPAPKRRRGSGFVSGGRGKGFVGNY
jgi:hypothetical protein